MHAWCDNATRLMKLVDFVVPLDVGPSKLMGSEVVVEARVCDNDVEFRRNDVVLGFSGSKIDECSSFVSDRDDGTCSASALLSWKKKQDTELYRSNYVISRSIAEGSSQGPDHCITNGSVALISESKVKEVQRRVEKVPRNGSGSLKKLKMLQVDNVLPQAEIHDTNMELDMLGSQFLKCSNAVDKSQSVKQRNNTNGRRGDRRNSKFSMKTKYDPFSPKAGLPRFSLTAGGSNAFGMYCLKPDVHDVTKLMEDIPLDKLLDGTYKCPSVTDKGKKIANGNDNVLDSVRKICSLIRLQRMQQGKETEEVDIPATHKDPSSLSPSDHAVETGFDGDGSSLADLSKCKKDLESCVKCETPAELRNSPLYQPRDVLEKLALPPPKDLESLLQDAVKPVASMKLADLRSGKHFSHRTSLPPFQWSHNFNGSHKSNNDALKTSNKSTCVGRWVRTSSTTSRIGGSIERFLDLDSLTYDDSLVPAGQLKYILPEVGKTSTPIKSEQDVPIAACPATSLPPPAFHPPKVLTAARTLCDMASHASKRNFGGIPKWPKQPSQKNTKSRKPRLKEIPEEEFSSPKSETVIGHVVRNMEYGSSSKKPKISLFQSREAVIALSSVSAPRSNRSSPSSLSRDSLPEARHVNGDFVKSSLLVPPLSRGLDRSNNPNPQKMRKIVPMDWNRMRS